MDVPTYKAASVSRREEASPRHYLGSESAVMAGEDLPAEAWNSERLPDMEFDERRDALLVGEDITDDEWWNERVHHPSKTVLQDVAASSYPEAASRPTNAIARPVGPAPEREPSSGAQGRPSSNEPQPERGTARAA